MSVLCLSTSSTPSRLVRHSISSSHSSSAVPSFPSSCPVASHTFSYFPFRFTGFVFDKIQRQSPPVSLLPLSPPSHRCVSYDHYIQQRKGYAHTWIPACSCLCLVCVDLSVSLSVCISVCVFASSVFEFVPLTLCI